MEEGYIKFNCEWVKARPVQESLVSDLNRWRNKLYALGLVGAYPNGVGFGNLSKRISKSGQFVITGSATGNLPSLTASHYSTVLGFDLEKNRLKCAGPIRASSESMTHAAIYQQAPGANAVIHMHHLGLWKSLLGKAPETGKEATYGTPGMAREIIRLFKETDVAEKKIIVMAGHEEGVLSFGRGLDDAGKALLGRFQG